MSESAEALLQGINASFAALYPDAQWLAGCVGLRDAENYTGCFPDVSSARELYEEVRDEADSQIATAREEFEEYEELASDYYDDVSDAVQNMKDFKDGFDTWFASAGIDTSDLGEWFGWDVSDFLVADPSWPSSVGITSSVPYVPGANELWGVVSSVFDDF